MLRVAAKVNYELDPTIDYPNRFVGHVKASLSEGRVVEEHQNSPRGGPELPMSHEEIEAKFRANAGLALSTEKIERLITDIRQMAHHRDLGPFLKSLSP